MAMYKLYQINESNNNNNNHVSNHHHHHRRPDPDGLVLPTPDFYYYNNNPRNNLHGIEAEIPLHVVVRRKANTDGGVLGDECSALEDDCPSGYFEWWTEQEATARRADADTLLDMHDDDEHHQMQMQQMQQQEQEQQVVEEKDAPAPAADSALLLPPAGVTDAGALMDPPGSCQASQDDFLSDSSEGEEQKAKGALSRLEPAGNQQLTQQQQQYNELISSVVPSFNPDESYTTEDIEAIFQVLNAESSAFGALPEPSSSTTMPIRNHHTQSASTNNDNTPPVPVTPPRVGAANTTDTNSVPERLQHMEITPLQPDIPRPARMRRRSSSAPELIRGPTRQVGPRYHSNHHDYSNGNDASPRAQYISATIIKPTKRTDLGLTLTTTEFGGVRIQEIATNGFLFVSGAPFRVGDQILCIKTNTNSYVCGSHVAGGLSKAEILRILRKATGPLTIIVQNETIGDYYPNMVESMTSKPHPNFGTGIFFVSGTLDWKTLQIHSVPSNGLFAHSLLHPNDQVLSINGVNCSDLDACVATDIVKSAPRFVSIVTQTTTANIMNKLMMMTNHNAITDPAMYLRSVPEAIDGATTSSSGRRSSLRLFRRR